MAFGLALSTTNSKTGYQDAVTPPWITRFAFLVYGATAAVIVTSWCAFGAYRGGLSVIVFLASVLASRQILPAQDSFHYKSLLIQSMASRYADYVRDNEKLWAAAMKDLLVKGAYQLTVYCRAKDPLRPRTLELSSAPIRELV